MGEGDSAAGADSLRDQVDLIREAFAYARRFKDAVFVFQFGAGAMELPGFPALVKDLALLRRSGIRVVLVPGGGKRIDEVLAQYGQRTEVRGGVRISRPEAMPLIEMAAFDVAHRLMSMLASYQADAVIGNFVKARALGVRDGVDYQDTGTVSKVHVSLLDRVMEDDFIPILPCIGWGSTGKPYNVSSVEIAARLAQTIRASKLFFLAPGPLFGEGALSLPAEGVALRGGSPSRMTVQGALAFLEANRGAGGPAMELLPHAAEACGKGVDRVHILDAATEGVVLKEIFSTSGVGLMVHSDPFESIRPMEARDLPDVLRVMEPHVRKGILVRRGEEELLARKDDYVVFETDGSVRGCGALHPAGPDQGEIAAIAVDEGHAQMGIGQRIVKYLIERARERGMRRAFLLTTQTSDWFLGLGFSPGGLEDLPEVRRAKYDASRNSRIYVYPLDQDK